MNKGVNYKQCYRESVYKKESAPFMTLKKMRKQF